jgi:hypothetical protein
MWAASKPERALWLLQAHHAQKQRFFLRIAQLFQQAAHFVVVPERDIDPALQLSPSDRPF